MVVGAAADVAAAAETCSSVDWRPAIRWSHTDLVQAGIPAGAAVAVDAAATCKRGELPAAAGAAAVAFVWLRAELGRTVSADPCGSWAAGDAVGDAAAVAVGDAVAAAVVVGWSRAWAGHYRWSGARGQRPRAEPNGVAELKGEEKGNLLL